MRSNREDPSGRTQVWSNGSLPATSADDHKNQGTEADASWVCEAVVEHIDVRAPLDSCGMYPGTRYSLRLLAMKKMALDAADIRILCALQQHGQLSKSELSELVGLSATPCWARFTKLKNAGLIRGYHADLAMGKIVDVSKVVVTVSLRSHRKTDFDRFEAHIRSRHEVTDCVATGGGMDYVLTVITTSLSEFQGLMEEMLSAEIGIDRYMTYIVTREIKATRPNLADLLSASAR